MAVKKINKSDFAGFVDTLIAESKVYGPTAKGDRYDFAALTSSDQLKMDYDVTLQPPKKFFQPPVETLMTYEVGGGYKSCFDEEKFVLLGVHPYDMIAINQMDELFSQGHYDTHYMTRRKNATIVALDVITPSENVFAGKMGTATVEKGFDVLLTDIGDTYIAMPATKTGDALLAKATCTDANEDDMKKRQAVQEENKQALCKHELKCDASILPELLEKAYDNPIWDKKAETCFACGSCNQVCPTCYCFNVQDDVNWDMATGHRCRAWDGCMLDGFAKVAGDHDFRKQRADRFRHRIYRKAKYVPAKIGGQIACVGCGRCVAACLPDIANPVNVFNQLAEELG